MIDSKVDSLRHSRDTRLVDRSLHESIRELEQHRLELQLQLRQDALVEENAKLELSCEHFAALFRDAPVAYFILDAKRRVIDANRAATRLTGILREALVGAPLVHLVDLGDLDRLHTFLHAPDEPSIAVALRPDGRPRTTVAVDKRTCPDERLFVTFTEIDLSNEAEDRAHARRLQLLGSSVCAISHELNNLMQKLGSLFGRIETRSTDADIRGLVQRGHGTVRYGADLLRRMLRFGQHHPPRTLPVVVDAVITSTLEPLRPIVGARIELVFDPGATGIQVMCDPSELELALFNLTTNARDAMPQGGQLRISTRVVMAAAGRRYLAITVQDTGCGMEPELQERLFEPFVTTKPVGKGSGLGLATTKSIIEAAHGTITVSSEVGTGTTFRLLLPVYVAPPLRLDTRTDETMPLPSVRPRSILVVEDNALSRRAVIEHLTAAGYEVHGTPRPSRAIELAHEQFFDVCILDLELPEMGGERLAEELRALQPSTRIVLASGIPAALVETHGAAFLQKPYGLADVVRAIEDA